MRTLCNVKIMSNARALAWELALTLPQAKANHVVEQLPRAAGASDHPVRKRATHTSRVGMLGAAMPRLTARHNSWPSVRPTTTATTAAYSVRSAPRETHQGRGPPLQNCVSLADFVDALTRRRLQLRQHEREQRPTVEVLEREAHVREAHTQEAHAQCDAVQHERRAHLHTAQQATAAKAAMRREQAAAAAVRAELAVPVECFAGPAPSPTCGVKMTTGVLHKPTPVPKPKAIVRPSTANAPKLINAFAALGGRSLKPSVAAAAAETSGDGGSIPAACEATARVDRRPRSASELQPMAAAAAAASRCREWETAAHARERWQMR